MKENDAREREPNHAENGTRAMKGRTAGTGSVQAHAPRPSAPRDGRYRACVSSTAAQSLIAILIAAAVGSAVFFHAERNQVRHPSAWASFVFLFMIIGLPLYVRHARRVRRSRA